MRYKPPIPQISFSIGDSPPKAHGLTPMILTTFGEITPWTAIYHFISWSLLNTLNPDSSPLHKNALVLFCIPAGKEPGMKHQAVEKDANVLADLLSKGFAVIIYRIAEHGYTFFTPTAYFGNDGLRSFTLEGVMGQIRAIIARWEGGIRLHNYSSEVQAFKNPTIIQDRFGILVVALDDVLIDDQLLPPAEE